MVTWKITHYKKTQKTIKVKIPRGPEVVWCSVHCTSTPWLVDSLSLSRFQSKNQILIPDVEKIIYRSVFDLRLQEPFEQCVFLHLVPLRLKHYKMRYFYDSYLNGHFSRMVESSVWKTKYWNVENRINWYRCITYMY